MLHRRAGRPDSRWHVGRITQQADRTFGDYLRGRAVAGIAVALHRGADLAAVGCDRDIKEIIEPVLTLLLRGALPRLGYSRGCHPVARRRDTPGLRLALRAGAGHLHLVVDKILSIREAEQHVGAV